ncbi:DUF924 family protein [Rhizorhabdus dicambivorans]|uniref:DUF924 domain-containing protein n=1 Tax=Rhizorhabdus dicambivorans TaxID=1850238 RepID=A0A2A4FRY0_9SPHN|nr:DUF924 family protein [Rhizorhabdus dicambivorans]ATE63808.1 DUF924 domain-containing protein [Rhizorhabdus dicambivorans]PCE40452.1 DUF924 domain-containing protein [Rhizorhabdus dicambivorans]
MVSPEEGTEAILGFWFGEVGSDRWWVRSQETDDAIVGRFRDLWEEWRDRTPESFLASPREALAGVALFDQFPRNMFRGHADAFSTDPLALAIAKGTVERGLDDRMSADERSFLYMPFQHSEVLADQQRSLALFTALGNQNSLDFARKHHDMIARYGRFPARNAALGRPDRPGEQAAIEMSRAW